MPPTSNRPFACPSADALSVHPKTVSNRRCLQNKWSTDLSDARADAAFHTAKSRALKKLRTSDGWSAMSLQAQQLAEHDVVQELDQARKAKKAGHEVEWMAKLGTGQVEADEVGAGQVADGDSGLVETNEGGGAQSVAVGDARCGKAFVPGEAGYQDEESDEWTTDSDDVEILRDLHG